MPGDNKVLLRQDRTIRVQFRVLVTLLCVILVAVTVWSFVADRRANDDRIGRETMLLARALSKHAADLMSVVDLLQAEAAESAARVRDGLLEQGQATADWRKRLARIDAVESVCVFDRWGHALLSTSRECARAPEADWFMPYPAIGGMIRQIGLPFQAHETSEWLIPTLHTWYDERAQPIGRVVVTLRSGSLVNVYDDEDAGGQLGVTLYRADGVMMTRFPQRPDLIGSSLAMSGLMRPAFSQISGVISGVSPIDGIERIRGFHRIPETALIVVVALSRESSAFWGRTGLVSVLLLVLLIGGVILVSRQLDRHLESNSDSREHMTIQARTDALTGLPNRRSFDEAIAREWRKADQSFTSLSMLLLDVDHFKSYNDTYGHQAGDECLRRVAYALRQASFETIGHLARYGGEEFAILLVDVTPAVAMLVARHMRAQIEAMAIPHAGNDAAGVVTVSIGVSTLDFAAPLGGSTPVSLVAEADKTLYEAKRAGRNRVEQFVRPAGDVIALRA